MKKIITVSLLIVLVRCAEPNEDCIKGDHLRGQQAEWMVWAKWYQSKLDTTIAIQRDAFEGKISQRDAVRRLIYLWANNTSPKPPHVRVIDSTQPPTP